MEPPTQDALGNTVSFSWDSASNLLQVTDALKRTTQMAYNTFNQATKVTDAIGGNTAFQYDAVGNRLTQSGGNAGFHFGDEKAADAEVSYT
ncbi:MAG: hypothetical protein ACYCW6_25570 [Candidatus Xenobia bacterium]